jgi:hypothetical protein
MSPKLAAIIGWVIPFVFFGGVGGYHVVPQLLNERGLSESAHVTQAQIIDAYPQIHSTCKYRFSVDGYAYEHLGRSCGEYEVGQTIAVYFSPNDPSNSINGDPYTWFVNDLIPFALVLILFPLLSSAIAYWRLRNGGSLWSRGRQSASR